MTDPEPESRPDPMLRRVLLAIGVVTMATGAAQAANPGLVLRVLSAKDDTTSRSLFGTVGMFMVVAGGTVVHGLLSPARQPIIVLWCAAQKLGAAVAVGTGVRRGVFSKLALLVAAFDLLTSALAVLYWSRLRRG
jgi:hypothetical protein